MCALARHCSVSVFCSIAQSSVQQACSVDRNRPAQAAPTQAAGVVGLTNTLTSVVHSCAWTHATATNRPLHHRKSSCCPSHILLSLQQQQQEHLQVSISQLPPTTTPFRPSSPHHGPLETNTPQHPATTTDFLANDKGVPRDKVKSWTPYPGGAPCNVATALSKLGVKTAFVSALGDDERGDEIMTLLKGIMVFV